MSQTSSPDSNEMRREIGLAGAILMGLGSIVGTGVFVSIGVASGVAGANVLVAVFLAALLATCNGLSSAQLAAAHPVSGGTYEYGYRWLTPWLGFSAGWLFLCAKSASAATALLGIVGYINFAMHGDLPPKIDMILIGVALSILFVLTIFTLIGIKRTNFINSVIVGTTLLTLATFVVFGFPTAISLSETNLAGLLDFKMTSANNLFHASALMFVAYTGYGRIATLGEEVKNPRKTIPSAMITTLAVTMLLYLTVGFVAVSLVGPDNLANSAKTWIAPLFYAASTLNVTWVKTALLIGALTAMLGVVLNLLLGLSRVALAMARRSDFPKELAVVNEKGIPKRATILVAIIITVLVLIGDIRLSWTFSAFTVLVYYSLTNLCAIRIEKESRLYPVWISWFGLIGCLGLATQITPIIALAGLAVLVGGHFLRSFFRASRQR